MFTLDVGSGHASYHNHRGLVNIDIRKPIKKYSNFIQADAHHLPFKDKVFEKSFLRELLYYLHDPSQALKELARVTTKELELSYPNPYHYRSILRHLRNKPIIKTDMQLYTWTSTEIQSLLKQAQWTIFNQAYYTNPDVRTVDRIAFKILPKHLGGRNILIQANKQVSAYA
jgi:ubiquinone/menaquinone biosynthesis C-methylase UbiE